MARTGTVSIDAEAQLFRELYPSLRRFAAVVGPLEVDPDDLVQEAVARALQSRRLTELDQPGAYLRRAILNLASNQRRRFARRRAALLRVRAGADAPADSYPSDLADLSRLPAEERAVLYLTEVEGYRYREAGQLIGCSEAAARKRALRGRRRLFEAIDGEVSHG
ncbi:MAG: sigma-70 family RNA polymerase sigma factor [Acidimicrobiia bacterium]|nr:sigma-70 family RNA polymerase sigma factor [Acidimicrobiia bacterium]MBT8191824.1 sigma-70 family RNA polymerase sigma factor [Acidimicrobiia bacterium]MBT8246366.1 sigma-70 family RNA polymerase sigma factor [Acidimicrobiia bacterium]NNF89144.1 sigma-70 family RNA polymerase sigma factor [Acidimicrobiia bacterium]NNJ48685.1 sigma-70 family RNA polymerase sigma factor [Acidimicrobiia bacterium]